ncbi:Ig-like domain-containing protein [Nocardia sp. NBC_00511]|uniref:Ig-like domain-containing protein n=1 Tax=Nocardia sp. NBC_00511 TaxID=2903591 RepID=UPI0030DEBE49
MRISQRTGLATGLFGAVVTAALVAAPQANALVTDLSAGSGSTFYVGQAYTVTATVTVTSGLFQVSFSDNGTDIGKVNPSGTSATIQWTPTTTGSHVIKATQELISSKTVTVNVTTAPVTPGGTGSASGNPLSGLLSSLSAQ